MRPVFFFPRATIIDCGTSRTSLAVFSGGRKGRLRLEQFAAVDHPIESGQDGTWLHKTTEALAELRVRAKPSGPASVVLPPHLTLMKMFSTPRVAAAKRDKIINFESQQSIPYPLSEVVWDRLIAGENSHSFNVLLCAAKLDMLDPLSAAVAGANMIPTALLPSAVALAACYGETQPEPATGTLLVGVGARSTTMVLLDKATFQARSLSLGSFGVTQQIAEMRSCDLIQAEQWKLNPTHAEEIAPVARMFANRLGQEVLRTLGHFHRPIAAENPLRIMLTGGGSRLPGLAGLLAAQMNVPVTLFDPMAAIDVGGEAGDFHREKYGETLPDLIGAAALHLRAAQPSINLLPPRLRQQAGRRRLRPWVALAAGLAVAATVPAVVHYHAALASAHSRNLAAERELALLRTAETRDQEYRQRLAETQRQQEAWRKIEVARTSWLRLLGEVQTKFNQAGNAWLERMRVVPPSDVQPVATAGRPPLRLALSGLIHIKSAAAEGADPENYRRVRSLLENVAKIPSVAAVESERFESAAGGLLRFDFVVVLGESTAF